MKLHRFIARGEGTLEARPDGNFMQYCDHAAFVERVREIAENMQHWETCDVLWREIPAIHNAEAYCTCVRGKLLEVCNG